jgi:putative phosphoesterase
MRIAILSDIHGNIDAFHEVIKRLKEERIDVVFFLGDQLGYYYDAVDVFIEIKKWKHYIIAGNHERIFIKYLESDQGYKNKVIAKYGHCFSYYECEFSKNLVEEIKDFPDEKSVNIDGYKFLLCHGSSLDKDQYIYPNSEKGLLRKLDTTKYDVVFMGHTHYPMIHKTENNVMLINVGSVGQARTIGGIANWGVFDTSNGVYSPQSTPYNIDLLEKFLIDKKEKEYLYKVLRRNNNTL